MGVENKVDSGDEAERSSDEDDEEGRFKIMRSPR
jgi:hypothetical protein